MLELVCGQLPREPAQPPGLAPHVALRLMLAIYGHAEPLVGAFGLGNLTYSCLNWW